MAAVGLNSKSKKTSASDQLIPPTRTMRELGAPAEASRTSQGEQYRSSPGYKADGWLRSNLGMAKSKAPARAPAPAKAPEVQAPSSAYSPVSFLPQL